MACCCCCSSRDGEALGILDQAVDELRDEVAMVKGGLAAHLRLERPATIIPPSDLVNRVARLEEMVAFLLPSEPE